MQIGFSDTTKMQHAFLSESAVLGMNKSPLKKVKQSGVVSK
jgi:muramoyltetrapeptide carboxypeptidase LdcA involved in peptidoglycan recycling